MSQQSLRMWLRDGGGKETHGESAVEEAKGGKWSSLANEVVRQPDRCGFSMARIDYPTNIHSQTNVC